MNDRTGTASQFDLLPEPWSLLGMIATEEADNARVLMAGLGPLFMGLAGPVPRQAGKTEGLASHGPPFRPKGAHVTLRTYDVPASDRRAEDSLTICAAGNSTTVTLAGQIPRQRRRGDSEKDWEVGRSAQLEAFIDSLVGTMLELRTDAEAFAGHSMGRHIAEDSLQPAPEPGAFEQGGRLPMARLPWSTVALRLLSERTEPRMDVIVRIACEFQDDLVRLAESPRKILRRERQLTPVGRVQQVDNTCLVWLVRQPGRTAVEKAGPTQQILAVVRTEDYDTLENRVLKDFLHRCISAADLYIREHKGRFQQSTRYRAVAMLRDTCRRLLRGTLLARVRPLSGLSQPNYVLLHDRAYRELWGWYVRLMRRQKMTDDAWRWQRRLWSDFVRLSVACEMIHAAGGQCGFSSRMSFAQDLWIREEQDAGSWLHAIDWPGPIWLNTNGRPEVIAQIIHPHGVAQDDTYDGLPVATWLGLTGADMAIVFGPAGEGTGGRRVCLLVWAIHSAAEELDDPCVSKQVQRAGAALTWLHERESPQNVAFRGLVMRSHLEGGMLDLPSYEASKNVEVAGACVSSDPMAWHNQEGVFGLRYVLYDCLTLAMEGA